MLCGREPSVEPADSFAARASLPYRLALGLVAVVMAVLPCVYVALTALTAWGTYLFATRYFVAIWQWPTGYNRGAVIVKVLCSCTPVLTGGTAAFFMVKPLFARRPARTQPLTLTPQAEPRVHALVQEVCRAAGGGPGGHGQGADDGLRPDFRARRGDRFAAGTENAAGCLFGACVGRGQPCKDRFVQGTQVSRRSQWHPGPG